MIILSNKDIANSFFQSAPALAFMLTVNTPFSTELALSMIVYHKVLHLISFALSNANP